MDNHFRAVADLSGLAALRALSFNHRDLGLQALAHVALAPDALAGLQASLAGADIEAFVLPTCNRTEIYWRARGSADDERVRALVSAVLNESGAALARVRPTLSGRGAAEHLFRVCCGLESLALGEPRPGAGGAGRLAHQSVPPRRGGLRLADRTNGAIGNPDWRRRALGRVGGGAARRRRNAA
jgi:hypothetical protein